MALHPPVPGPHPRPDQSRRELLRSPVPADERRRRTEEDDSPRDERHGRQGRHVESPRKRGPLPVVGEPTPHGKPQHGGEGIADQGEGQRAGKPCDIPGDDVPDREKASEEAAQADCADRDQGEMQDVDNQAAHGRVRGPLRLHLLGGGRRSRPAVTAGPSQSVRA